MTEKIFRYIIFKIDYFISNQIVHQCSWLVGLADSNPTGKFRGKKLLSCLLWKLNRTYTEWPHRQCVGMAFRRSHGRGSLSAVSLVICSPARIAVCNTRSSGGTALCRVGGATSQLALPSLTPLSVAGCG